MAKVKLVATEAAEAGEGRAAEWGGERLQLEHKIAQLTSELDEARHARTQAAGPPRTPIRDHPHHHHGSSSPSVTPTQYSPLSSSVLQSPSPEEWLSTLQPGHQPGMPAGGGFVVQLEKLHQAVKQREAEAATAVERQKQVEHVCEALSTEVRALGKRNTELEAAAGEAAKLKRGVAALEKRNNVLLELLGEKTETLEEALASLEDAKSALRKHLEQALPAVPPRS